MSKRIELYGDKIGHVELVDCLGSDLSVVNSARVSFGKHKETIEYVGLWYKNYYKSRKIFTKIQIQSYENLAKKRKLIWTKN